MKEAIIVFSHLRWDFVYQRPQHLLTRLAQHRKVIFFEEPAYHSGESFIEYSTPENNVIVCRPHTSVKIPGFHDEQLPYLNTLVKQMLEDQKLDDYAVWFYTPMALPLAQVLDPKAIIYDCMDELSAFLNAPRQLLQRETALLKAADVVFTGGPSLYGAKKDRHSNVHCFSSSVDAAHFGQAKDAAIESPLQKELSHPRFGFFGVIDERLDLTLLDALAVSHPEWEIVMVGPVVKIDPASLPSHANIHYYGQQSYADLPKFLAGWDVCLLPFARNDATRFISPTKTLEYMAAEKPIVSTPITDVAEPYGEIVYLADGPNEFIAACEHALNASDSEKSERFGKMRDVLSHTSWDATAAAMNELIAQSVQSNADQPKQSPVTRTQPNTEGTTTSSLPRVTKNSNAQEVDNIVIGAGPTGLSAAYHLGESSLLLEQNATVGGWCRSIEDNGFTFDFAGHIMFSNDPYVHQLYEMLLGDNVHWQEREAWVYSKNVFTRYPFQGALYGLPPEVIKECITGAIEARFGPLKNKPIESVKPADKTATTECKSDDAITDCCADGIMESTAPLVPQILPFANRRKTPRNFEDFIYSVWGSGIAKHFAIPYNQKLWAVPLKEMETSWLGGRVPLPDLEEMIDGALQPVGKPMGPNARFGYPLRGGFQALMDGFLPHLKGELKLDASVVNISPSAHTLTLADGNEYKYQTLVNTMPLPKLISLMGDEAPTEVQNAAKGLRHVSVKCVNLGIAREKLTDKHWIYYPEDSVFHRIFVQGNASPHCNAPGGFGITCEITYSEYKPLPCDGEDLIKRCIEDCIKVGMFTREDAIIAANIVDMPYAYVVYDHARPQNVATIRTWLEEQDIILAGRYSEWEYYNSDHAFLAGKKASIQVQLQQARTKLRA